MTANRITRANWLALSPFLESSVLPLYILRGHFRLPALLGSARAVIAAESKYWLYLNGQSIVREGGLKRGQRPGTTYADTVDVSPYLRAGENVVAVQVWHFDKSGFSHADSGQAGFLLEIQSDDGEVLCATNTDWQWTQHPAYFDAGYRRDGYRLSERSLGYDARLEPGDWMQPGFAAPGWRPAVEAGLPPVPPWGPLLARKIPQWRWSELRTLTCEEMPGDDADSTRLHARLPTNLQFTPSLEVEAPAGLRIDLWPGLGTTRLQVAYITREGRQVYEFSGWLNGDDLLVRLPKEVQLLRLAYRESGYDADFAGGFSCNDAGLNRLVEKARRTLYVTMRDTFMDCPCRERAPWPGDMVVQLGQVPYCLDRSADALIRKGLLEIIGWQRSDGVLYGPVPGNWEHELPAQSLALLSRFGAYTYYLNTGDVQTLSDFQSAALKYLDVWKLDERGVIEYRAGGWDWPDWGAHYDAPALLGAWYALALEGTMLSARTLGHDAMVAELATRITAYRESFRRVYHGGETGFRSPAFTEPSDDRVQALAVLARLHEPVEAAALAKILFERREASAYMEKYVLEALCQLGKPELALARIRERFANVIASDCSTLPEHFGELNDDDSPNHSWTGGPLTLCSQYLAGLKPTAPGWESFAVCPQPGDLTQLEASVLSPHGLITLKLRKTTKWVVELRFPAGCVPEPDWQFLVAPEGVDLR